MIFDCIFYLFFHFIESDHLGQAEMFYGSAGCLINLLHVFGFSSILVIPQISVSFLFFPFSFFSFSLSNFMVFVGPFEQSQSNYYLHLMMILVSQHISSFSLFLVEFVSPSPLPPTPVSISDRRSLLSLTSNTPTEQRHLEAYLQSRSRQTVLFSVDRSIEANKCNVRPSVRLSVRSSASQPSG
jgi:hypothetical protein